MARVTVEDCVEKVANRFELVLVAAQRSRQISSGAPLLVERDNDKNPIVALREIAEGYVDQSILTRKAEPKEYRDSAAFHSAFNNPPADD